MSWKIILNMCAQANRLSEVECTVKAKNYYRLFPGSLRADEARTEVELRR